MGLLKEIATVGVAAITTPLTGFEYLGLVKDNKVKNPSFEDFWSRATASSALLLEGEVGNPRENAEDMISGVQYTYDGTKKAVKNVIEKTFNIKTALIAISIASLFIYIKSRH